MIRRLCFCLGLACATYAAQACTIFLVARGGQVLMGANEDMVNESPYDKHWISFQARSDKHKLGYAAFGYNAVPFVAQAGMNESGLFLDYNALPKLDRGPKGKPQASALLGEKILGECSTVDEALALIKQYDWVGLSAGQMVIGDATGASAIVERDAITRRKAELDFQIGTNFRTSETPEAKIDCWRYRACEKDLKVKGPVTTDFIRSLLAKTSPYESTKGKTISWYSQVCDLRAKKMWLYRKGDFSRSTLIDLRAELAKGSRRVDMDEFIARSK